MACLCYSSLDKLQDAQGIPLQPVYYTRPLEALAYQHGTRILYILPIGHCVVQQRPRPLRGSPPRAGMWMAILLGHATPGSARGHHTALAVGVMSYVACRWLRARGGGELDAEGVETSARAHPKKRGMPAGASLRRPPCGSFSVCAMHQ